MNKDFEDLFEWPNPNDGDLSIWKTIEHFDHYDIIDYHIGIEGYICYKNIKEAVDYYQDMLDKLSIWISSYKREHPNKNEGEYKICDTDLIYRVRDIEVRYNNDCYWIFTYPPEFGYIDGCKEWLEDVVKQLKTIREK